MGWQTMGHLLEVVPNSADRLKWNLATCILQARAFRRLRCDIARSTYSCLRPQHRCGPLHTSNSSVIMYFSSSPSSA